MGKLGISIYPDKMAFSQIEQYMRMAAKYHFSEVFTSLLQVKGSQKDVINTFKPFANLAKELNFDVIIDLNPALFQQLDISFDDLSFFNQLGVAAVRLDQAFSGIEEAIMTNNPYGIKIELNMSAASRHVETIKAFGANLSNLTASHNFYPQRYTGLETDFFKKATKIFTDLGLTTAAFINSQAAEIGPWPLEEGMPTLEIHRDLPIETQVTHFRLLGGIDNLLISNAVADENELKAAAEAFFSPFPIFHVDLANDSSDLEKEILFKNSHFYRGDLSGYMIRSTQTRVKYRHEDIPAHDTDLIQTGDVLIENSLYGQYKGETQIALKPMKNSGRTNVVAKITTQDKFLLSCLKPWAGFLMKSSLDS